MSSIDINIVERGLNGQSWTAEKGKITASDLEQVVEQRTNSSSALNALPTPFARFFVVKEAFRRVLNDTRSGKNDAGRAYERLVSDTLDVFELLYNLKYHRNKWPESCKVVIREWSVSDNLQNLIQTVPVLGHSLSDYIAGDIGSELLFFIILEDDGKEYLLATSSPYTGFVTPPDLDKKDDKTGETNKIIGKRYHSLTTLKRKNRGLYFRDTVLFADRDKDFKNYMYNLFDKADDKFKELRDYIKQHKSNGDKDYDTRWIPNTDKILSENNNELIVEGIHLGMDKSLGTVNFFNDNLICVPYQISKDNFICMEALAQEPKSEDYLVPINSNLLEEMADNFKISYKKACTYVEVILEYKGQSYTKKYDEENIVKLDEECINFNLALFPNILSSNKSENNYFKVHTVLSDTNDYMRLSIDSVNLDFYYKDEVDSSWNHIDVIDKDDKNVKYGLRKAVVRTRQNHDKCLDASSKLYEIFNIKFDAINIGFELNGKYFSGLIFPKWRDSLADESCSFTYAVDLGTTNTYISCRKTGENYEPEQLQMKDAVVSFLHNSKQDKQKSFVSVIEDGLQEGIKKNFLSEFVPSIIDGQAYKFPIRTALCVTNNENKKGSLFDKYNIAFFYGKKIGLPNQTIYTEIKWNDDEYMRRLFIRELLLLIKVDILQKKGTLSDTMIIWFKPLNFKGSIKESFERIWKEESSKILGINSENIQCLSESEAPYYYFKKKNSFESVDAVSIVDIGGGSCDFVYFKNNKPEIASSVNFGCDVLWGSGFCGFDNNRDNGIYTKYKDRIRFAEDKELEQLNSSMIRDSKTSTKEIINLWLDNSDKCGVMKSLKNDYKPLFLYHFAAIVYYMAQMYKSKGLDCPRAVLFCGNGSKYIDTLLSSNTEIIENMVSYVFDKVYGNIKNVQVVLPEIRKESTCYGGLYHDRDMPIPAEYIYQGGSHKEYESVKKMKDDMVYLKECIKENIEHFHKIYKDLLTIMQQKKEIEGKVEINKYLNNDRIEDSIIKNFKTQVVDKLSDDDIYPDSIFFFPIIDNIYSLTKI